MISRTVIASLLAAMSALASPAIACVERLPAVPLPRNAGENEAEYLARAARLTAEAQAMRQAEDTAWALNRENSLWDSGDVTRIAVVDVVDVSDPGDGPPMTSVDFVFSAAIVERGMTPNERFVLNVNRVRAYPCVEFVTYPVGSRYILFSGDGPISQASQVQSLFLLMPAADVRSERGRALLAASTR